MQNIQSYKDLIVWQKSINLVKEIYKLTSQLPQKEIYGLASQMQRAAVSIPSNIAEGRGRGTRKDFGQFLRIAYGSSSELETQLIIIKSLYATINTDTAESLLIEIKKMTAVMISKLKAESSKLTANS